MSADYICAIENGSIVEYGTNRQLLLLNGVNKNLYDKQFKNEKAENIREPLT
jgi:ABC-type multidrug transport system fused ATPase/permease subunit